MLNVQNSSAPAAEHGAKVRSTLDWARDIQMAAFAWEGMDRARFASLISQAPDEALSMAFSGVAAGALSRESNLASRPSHNLPDAADLQGLADLGYAVAALIGGAPASARFDAAAQALTQGRFASADSPSTLLLSGMPLDDERIPVVILEAEQISSRGLPLLLDAVGAAPEERARALGVAINRAAVMDREDAFMHLMGAAGYPTLPSTVAEAVTLQLEEQRRGALPSHAIVAVVAARSALETSTDGARVSALIETSRLASDEPETNASFLKDVARWIKDPILNRDIQTLDPIALMARAQALVEADAALGLGACAEKMISRRSGPPEMPAPSISAVPKI